MNGSSNSKTGAVVHRIYQGKTLLFWLLFALMLGLAVHFGRQKTTSPIVLDSANISATQVSALTAVTEQLGEQSFYGADLQQIADKVAAVSWVQSVQVSRDWQRGIVVQVIPRVAVANFGSEHLLDISGEVFVPATPSELNSDKRIDVYGAPEDAKRIMAQVYQLNAWFAPVNLSVQDVILTPRETWLVRFNNGLRLTVDYERVDDKLYAFSQLLKNDSLPLTLSQIASADLRYKNGFSLTKKGQEQL